MILSTLCADDAGYIMCCVKHAQLSVLVEDCCQIKQVYIEIQVMSLRFVFVIDSYAYPTVSSV